ncbi:hypothetical protein ACPEIC_40510 [Stenotrophomonas sp. NPDC087984]
MTAAEAVQSATDVVRRKALTIAEILAHESALMDLPTFFKACGIPESTGYQVAAEGRLPLEVIPLGRRRYVRTVDAWKFLGLLSENDDSAGAVTPTPSVEHVNESTAQQIGTSS